MEKSTQILKGLLIVTLVLAILIVLKSFLIPFAYGLLIALIIYPVCKKLENKKVPRSLAIFISILLVVLILGFVVFIFIYQIKVVNKDIPELLLRIQQSFPNTQEWVRTTFGLSLTAQDDLISNIGKNISSNLGNLISGSFSIAAEIVLYLVIIPLYSVLILYYRKTLVNFAGSLMGKKYKEDLPAILAETILMYFNYIKGMIGVYLTVGVLNSIGLLILGVDYAILFGMVTAFMTIIPYVGIIISSLLPITMIWSETNNILYPLGVVAIFSIVQYLEANIIFPYIVGKQIGINTLVSIIAIFVGGVLWGLSGMLLFLPFIAILKIISGHIPDLKPLNEFLEIPPDK